jgi:hypothetical protein
MGDGMNREQIIKDIARQHLHIETLETRKSDALDFHSVAVWSVKKALEAAFDAGKLAAVQDEEPDFEYSGDWISMTVDEAGEHLKSWIEYALSEPHLPHQGAVARWRWCHWSGSH